MIPVAASSKKLFVTIAVLIALAVIGVVVYTGNANKGAAPEQLQGQQTADVSADIIPSSPPPVAAMPETPADDGAAGSETASTSGHAFDLTAAMAPRSIGNPNAPIKIVEYASLTCTHCAHFHNDILPQMKTKYIDTGKVYLQFQEFPLNAPALDAALLARCLPSERYESFTGLLFKTQEEWTARPDYITSLKQNAKLAGMSEQGIDDCLKSNDLRSAIGKAIKEASDKYKISSTPTFVINDGAEVIRGAMPLEAFESAFTKISGGAPATTPEAQTPAAGNDAAPAPEQPAE